MSSQLVFASDCLVTAFNAVLFCSRRYQLANISKLVRQSQSQCYVTTDDRLANQFRCQAQTWGP
jgi:hypothetical protein